MHVDLWTRKAAQKNLRDRGPSDKAGADKLMDEHVYVIGFFYPVVPKGQARIRTQMSAAHTPEQIDQAVAAFTKVGKELGVI